MPDAKNSRLRCERDSRMKRQEITVKEDQVNGFTNLIFERWLQKVTECAKLESKIEKLTEQLNRKQRIQLN